MNYQDYDKLKANLEKDYRKKEYMLAKEYALSNVKAKIGDIVTDGDRTIKIEAATVSVMFSSHPYCVWKGLEYTKSGKPRKDERIGHIRDSSITEIK